MHPVSPAPARTLYLYPSRVRSLYFAGLINYRRPPVHLAVRVLNVERDMHLLIKNYEGSSRSPLRNQRNRARHLSATNPSSAVTSS